VIVCFIDIGGIDAQQSLNFLFIIFDLILIVFNTTFSNISTISWRPVLVVEEAGDLNIQPITTLVYYEKEGPGGSMS
jgi:hypothetical protein